MARENVARCEKFPRHAGKYLRARARFLAQIVPPEIIQIFAMFAFDAIEPDIFPYKSLVVFAILIGSILTITLNLLF